VIVRRSKVHPPQGCQAAPGPRKTVRTESRQPVLLYEFRTSCSQFPSLHIISDMVRCSAPPQRGDSTACHGDTTDELSSPSIKNSFFRVHRKFTQGQRCERQRSRYEAQMSALQDLEQSYSISYYPRADGTNQQTLLSGKTIIMTYDAEELGAGAAER
jgi:hypothetical protein